LEKVHMRILNELGHESLEMTPEEAVQMIFSQRGRYFIVDEETRTVMNEITPQPGQRIALIPIARGG
jgi:uncharacterized protein YlzI (FlbEa/FlbD family)